MANSSARKLEINVRDLSTKSVTFFPSRALVVREIKDLQLNNGPNVVEIYGLTPTVDENSVQINGIGRGSGSSATITDVAVDCVPNREVFDIVHAIDDSEEEGVDETGSGFGMWFATAEEDGDEENDSELQALLQEEEHIRCREHAALEMRASAECQLKTWDQYSNSMLAENSSIDKLSAFMKIYRTERTSLYHQHSEATKKAGEASKALLENRKQLATMRAKVERSHKKSKKLKMKQRYQDGLKKAAKRAEASRKIAEKRKFWPRMVYRVTLHLDCVNYTPASSRRGSVNNYNAMDNENSSAASSQDNDSDTTNSVDLSLSYITTEAGWRPRYDFKLSSVKMSASIIYRAEYRNSTSETWSDANISFSTSHTTINSAEESRAPPMNIWRIKAAIQFGYTSGDLQSSQEANKGTDPSKRSIGTSRPNVFGTTTVQQNSIQEARDSSNIKDRRKYIGSLFGGSQPSNNVGFGQIANASNEAIEPQLQNTSESARCGEPVSLFSTDEEFSAGPTNYPFDSSGQDLTFEETNYEESGLTSVYEVSGAKTLQPSSMKRLYNIATFSTPVKVLSHTTVPKLRRNAYLYATLRNPSSQSTILKGIAGVTLDNTFIGTIMIDRIGPYQEFKLPLGPDSGVRVSYPKPTTQRRTVGTLDKCIVTQVRSIRVENIKATPVTIKVLDQVPEPESGDVEVKIIEPRGLDKKGDCVATGADAAQATTKFLQADKPSKATQELWGNATATLEQNGRVVWDCVIEKGRACLLNLSYEVWLPINSQIANC